VVHCAVYCSCTGGKAGAAVSSGVFGHGSVQIRTAAGHQVADTDGQKGMILHLATAGLFGRAVEGGLTTRLNFLLSSFSASPATLSRSRGGVAA
jgi:hypothetical protein